MVNGGGVMRKRLMKTIKDNGFLLFLFMCVCLVAGSTIFVIMKEVDKPGDNKDFVILNDEENSSAMKDEWDLERELSSDETSDFVDEEEDEPLEVTTLNESDDDDVDLEESEEIPKEAQEDEIEDEILEKETTENLPEEEDIEFIDEYKEENEEINKSLINPVEGDILTVFTTDSLIYSKTLDEWRGHPGIDIKAEAGEKVKVVKGGTVKKIEEDKLWGITVTIDHGDGLETKYANLGTKEMVQEGIQVNQGDYIGTVGKTATIEMLMDDHLHFEVIKDGKLVDPRSILE